MKTTSWLMIVLIPVAVAAGLRLPRLTFRPMHTDEAVHAFKLGQLIETGRYQYDPFEYHGPTLNAFSLPIAWLRGQASYRTLDETTLRLVPALFGIALVGLLWLFHDALGRRATILAMWFTALSPAFVYYSRYYIQEVLLVFFTMATMGCAWRYIRRPHWGWALGTGVALALMQATKETCIIAWGCMGLAGVIVVVLERARPFQGLNRRHIWGGGVAALVVSVLLFSWFLTNPTGWLDAWRSYVMYVSRGHGPTHTHPWSYYLDLLTWIEGWEWPGWNEDYVVVLAVVGLFYAFCKKHLKGTSLLWLRFLALYSFFMVMVYSSLSYKTPWSFLGALHGMILLAAVATDQLLRTAAEGWERRVIIAFVAIFGLLSPSVQSLMQNFRYEADQTNPYVYAHTHRDIFKTCERIRAGARIGGQGTMVQAICPAGDYWPLPWYLRDLENVGYWSQVDANTPLGDIIVTQPSLQQAVQGLVYERLPLGQRELYVPMLAEGTQLRHGVPLQVYTRKSLWDRLVLSEAIEEVP